MTEFRSLRDGSLRPPTAAERLEIARMREQGIDDVYVEPEHAPQGFWENVVQATSSAFVRDRVSSLWHHWEQEIRWAQGWREFKYSATEAYDRLVRHGSVVFAGQNTSTRVPVVVRLAAVEHLLDYYDDPVDDFVSAVNGRARWHRVALRIEGARFVPLTSEQMHVEVVQPTLVLLADPAFEPINGLYRKAFDRALSGDPAGAITAATSAVEEMFRLGLGIENLNMQGLAERARQDGWVPAAVYQFAVKLEALRSDSDAHTPGTDEFNMAMLAIHLAGSILLYLGKTRDFAGE